MKSLFPDLRGRGGFSMIELLMASILIAGAGGMLIASLVSANRSASMRAEQALLGQFLASQLALLDDPLPAVLPESGPLPQPFQDHAALVTVGGLPPTTLQQAALSVEHGAHRVALVTWRRPVPDEQP